MKESKWIVQIEDVKYLVYATSKEDAIERALATVAIKAYPYVQEQASQRD